MGRNSELGETFRAWDAMKKEKRAYNLAQSTELLKARNIPFVSKNNGIHLQLESFDFWPSTGKFINRKTKKTGRGVFALIREVENDSR